MVTLPSQSDPALLVNCVRARAAESSGAARLHLRSEHLLVRLERLSPPAQQAKQRALNVCTLALLVLLLRLIRAHPLQRAATLILVEQ